MSASEIGIKAMSSSVENFIPCCIKSPSLLLCTVRDKACYHGCITAYHEVGSNRSTKFEG